MEGPATHCSTDHLGEILETKRVPADINPIWNNSFTLNGVEEHDMVEILVVDHGTCCPAHGWAWPQDGGAVNRQG